MDLGKLRAGGRNAAAPIKAAFAIGAGTALLMLCYEALKERFFPGLTKWGSHSATIAVAGLFSGAAGYFASCLFQKANRSLLAENAVRIEAEAAAKKALDEKAALLRELQHRAKNSFALITSLVGLAEAESASSEASLLLSETGARVSAIAELYDLLYASGSAKEVELGEYLGRIAGIVADRPRIRLVQELDRGVVAADEAIPLGLIVTELATNVLKHAYPDGRGGEVRISTRFGAAGLSLEFGDDGAGMPAEVEREKPGSLGLSLVRTMARQLGGSCETDSSSGTAWRFRFPGIRPRGAGAAPSP